MKSNSPLAFIWVSFIVHCLGH